MEKPVQNVEDKWINIHRTKMKQSNWLKLQQIADAMDITREELLNTIVETYIKHVKVGVSRK